MTARLYHFAAIVGGAIAGSVAAEILADHGIQVGVIEQYVTPGSTALTWQGQRSSVCSSRLFPRDR